MGSFIAPLITGLLARDYGWHLGFGIGGLGMLIALLIFRFWLSRNFKLLMNCVKNLTPVANLS